jgi:squalene-hopene/tetraprenyl-beta-curcumene cyclase
VNAFVQSRIDHSTRRAIDFLRKNQRRDGSFLPLWFGNENGHDDQNPVYGTAQVLIALNELAASGFDADAIDAIRERSAHFLIEAQHTNGGWGGDRDLTETIEETALALEALSGCEATSAATERGISRLLQLVEASAHEKASPIGFYFARLWYYERLYPLIFATSALGAVVSRLQHR